MCFNSAASAGGQCASFVIVDRQSAKSDRRTARFGSDFWFFIYQFGLVALSLARFGGSVHYTGPGHPLASGLFKQGCPRSGRRPPASVFCVH